MTARSFLPSLCRSCALVAFVASVSACKGASGGAAKATTAAAGAISATPVDAGSGTAVDAASSLPAASPVLAPAPSWRASEPDRAALAAARLSRVTCEEETTDWRAAVEARIARMRAELEERYDAWRKRAPCTAELRRDHLSRGQGWSLSGADFPSGGLGLGGRPGVRDGVGAGHDPLGRTPADVDAAASASGTNSQAAGVDEGDLVKTDGKYVYVLAHGALRIIGGLEARLVSVTPLAGEVRELLVAGDRAVVFASMGKRAPRCTRAYECEVAADGSHTAVTVLDIADRAHPRRVRELALSGSLVTSHHVGSTVHLMVADPTPDATPEVASEPDDLPWCPMDVEVTRARFTRLARDNERKLRAAMAKGPALPTLRDGSRAATRLCNLFRSQLDDASTFISLVSFDLRDDADAPVTATVKTPPAAVYAGERRLYLAVPHARGTPVALGGASTSFPDYAAASDLSYVHAFDIGASPRETGYAASGVVPGRVLSQFGMDEADGMLRIATTMRRAPDPKAESTLSILAMAPSGGVLERVGAVEHIAPAEDLRAVRFDGDRAYVVTFKKTDPLLLLDLATPTAPKIVGALTIPGFSTYLHRIDRDHLLSIGFAADDEGSFAYFNGVILQLFDVQIPTAPKLLFQEKVGSRGSTSQAATDHLALNYFAPKGLLAFPMTVCEGGGNGGSYRSLVFSGLLVYGVSVGDGFTRLGGVDHGVAGATCSTWWSQATSAVKRSVFLDDLVYSVATDRLKVQRMGSLGTDVASVDLTTGIALTARQQVRFDAPEVMGRLPPEIVQGVIRKSRPRIERCYASGLRADSALRGRVALRFLIRKDGNVSTVSLGGSDLYDGEVVACVVRSYQGLRFPPPEGGVVTVTQRLTFSSGD